MKLRFETKKNLPAVSSVSVVVVLKMFGPSRVERVCLRKARSVLPSTWTRMEAQTLQQQRELLNPLSNVTLRKALRIGPFFLDEAHINLPGRLGAAVYVCV